MLSINDRKKIIKYLNEHKEELKNVQDDLKVAITELETKTVQEVLTKRRLGEIFYISNLFIRFLRAISESFEEE